MITQKEAEPINNAYAPLFDLINQEYGKILLISEMDEIISASNKVQENLQKLQDNNFIHKSKLEEAISEDPGWKMYQAWIKEKRKTDPKNY